MVIRGSTDNLMDDIERAVDDGVNTFKVLIRVSQTNKPMCKCRNVSNKKIQMKDYLFLLAKKDASVTH